VADPDRGLRPGDSAAAARARQDYAEVLSTLDIPAPRPKPLACAEIIAAGDGYDGPLAEPVRQEATRLISSLR
jgi:hypothetical protein